MAKNKKNSKNNTPVAEENFIEFEIVEDPKMKIEILESRIKQLNDKIAELKDAIVDLSIQNHYLSNYNQTLHAIDIEDDIFRKYEKPTNDRSGQSL